MGERVGVSDDEWALIGPLLPSERGRGCRPAGDNRPYFEGMIWMARSGAQWRLLPDEYGKWNSVFRRYRRWALTGVFDALLETLSEMVTRDTSADMIDSTVVRAHHCAVWLKKGIQSTRGLAGRAAASPPSAIRDEIEAAGVEAVIPAKSNRRVLIPHDRKQYRWRNLVERLFSKLKNWRRVAAQYDKTRESTLGFAALASIRMRIAFVHVA